MAASYISLYFGEMQLDAKYTFRVRAYNDSYLHKVVIKCGDYSKTYDKLKGDDADISFTPPLEWANAMPNTTSINGTMTLTTYESDYSTKVGVENVRAVKFVIGTSALKPTLSLTVEDDTDGIADKFGAYVQMKSKLRVTIDASGQYGATISSYKTTFNGVTYSGESFVTNTLTFSGTYKVSTTVTDSRGKTTTVTKTVEILPYEYPKTIGFSTVRADSAGNPNTSGQYLLASVNFSIAEVDGLNDCSYSVEYKVKGASGWTVLRSGSVYSLNENIVSSGAILNTNSSYETRLVVSDYFREIVTSGSVGTSFQLIHYNANGKAVAFCKMSEVDEGVEFGGKVYFDNAPVINGGQKILWEGSSQMAGSDSVSLSESISKQPNGIVLVFSYIIDGYIYDSDSTCFFVPKLRLSIGDNNAGSLGAGVNFFISGQLGNNVSLKKLYLNDTFIRGDSENEEEHTYNGITYKNSTMVLRYVIGV